jgi:hypothetical protein
MKLTTITIALVAGAALTALSGVAHGQTGEDRTGNGWLKTCREGKWVASDTRRPVNCLGYVRGFADALQVWQRTQPDLAQVCVPTDVRSSQLYDLALLYLRDHPAQRHKDIAFLLRDALVDAFPCKNKN